MIITKGGYPEEQNPCNFPKGGSLFGMEAEIRRPVEWKRRGTAARITPS